MATFGSSTINKSSKRFAPRAGPRRSTGTPQTTAQASARGSIEKRTSSITPAPVDQEHTSIENQGSINSIQRSSQKSHSVQTPSKSSKNVDASKFSNIDTTEPLDSAQDRRHTTTATKLSVVSRRTQDSQRRSSDQELQISDEALHVSPQARRSSRVRKEVPVTDAKRPSRKRQRSGSLGSSQIISTIESPTRSRQQALGPKNRQTNNIRASQNEPNISESSAENLESELRAPSAIFDSNTVDVDTQSVAVGGAKSSRKKKQKNHSPANTNAVSKSKKKASQISDPGQSQFRVEGQPESENDTGDITGTAGTDDIENVQLVKRRRRRRAQTPEESDKIEIATAVVKMSELCKDLGTGKKSKRAEEIEKLDWTEVVRKQRERKARRETGELPHQETVDEMLHRVREEEEVALQLQQGPQMRLVNGQLVVDDASLQVDRHAAAAQSTENLEEVEESELTRRVNSGTWMKREKTEIWNDEEISLLYRGLRMFGTDFEIISKMFPLRSRRQIKLRYNKEERIDPNRVKQALSGKTTEMDLEEYSRLTDVTYEDPAIFNAEMERKRQEHELEQQRLDEERAEEARRKREDNERSAEPEEDDGHEGSQKENDVQLVNAVASSTGKPKKTKRKVKKPATGKANKKSQHSRKVAGEAEVLGPVDEV